MGTGSGEGTPPQENRTLIIERRRLLSDHFTQIPNTLLRHPDLSIKAKGLWSWMASHQEGWKTSQKRMADELGCGVDAIRTGLQELIAHGWLARTPTKNPDGSGRFCGYTYVLYDNVEGAPAPPPEPVPDLPPEPDPEPAPETTVAAAPSSDNPIVGKSHNGKTPHTEESDRIRRPITTRRTRGGAGAREASPASAAPPPPSNLDPDEPRCARHAHVAEPPPCMACKRVRESRPVQAPPPTPTPGLTADELRRMVAEREKNQVSPERAHEHYRRISEQLARNRSQAS